MADEDGALEDRRSVEQACKIDHGLTEWEVSFVESIAKQVIDERKTLTSKQRTILTQILDKGHCEDDED